MLKPTIVVAVLVAGVLLSAASAARAQAAPDVKALIEELKDKDEAIRLRAAKVLGRLKEKAKEAIPALTTALQDPDEDVRSVAKKSLAAVTEAVEAEAAVKKLAALEEPLKALRSAKTPKDKIIVLQKLAEFGGVAKEAGPAIVSIGMMDTNANVRESAANALAKIDPPVHKEIMVLLTDKEAENKLKSISALSEMGVKGKAAAPILKLIYVEDRKGFIGKGLWEPALTGLTKLTPDDPTVHDAVLAIIANPQESQNAQELALKLLKTLKVDTKKKVVALMAGVEKGMNYRAYMIGELGGMRGDAKAALPLLKKLKNDSDNEIRKAAAEAVDSIMGGG